MLIVLSGLPGTGKSTLARALARDLRAAHLRVDSVEAALLNAGLARVTVEGYAALYAVAADQLSVGLPVVVDLVNPVTATREAWADVAARAGATLVNVEVTCTDPAEHRRRVETRHTDAGRWAPPTWADVQATAHHYEPWTTPVLRLDTAHAAPAELIGTLRARLPDAGTLP
jgi:predicted kinase